MTTAVEHSVSATSSSIADAQPANANEGATNLALSYLLAAISEAAKRGEAVDPGFNLCPPEPRPLSPEDIDAIRDVLDNIGQINSEDLENFPGALRRPPPGFVLKDQSNP